MNTNKKLKITLLLLILFLVMLFLSSCYIEPDKTQDTDTNIGNNGQNFEPIVTPTPTATPVATPTPEPVATAEPIETTDVPNLDSPTINLDVFTKPTDGTGNTTGTGTTNVTTQPTTSVGGTQETPEPTSKATATPAPTSSSLKNGSEGDRVKELQKRLKQLGYYTGSEDGKFGAGTEAALKAFQKANNLKSDGVAGNATLKVLYGSNPIKAPSTNNSNNNANTNTNTNNTTPKVTAKPNIPKNKYISTTSSSTGTDVRNLQNRLIELGYLAGTADGTYGSSTEKAVIAFQKRNMPYADGIAGPETLTKLYSSSAKKSSKPVAVVAKAGHSLKEGDKGEAVRTLQRRLIELGYLSGSADGTFGPSTKQAVMTFQNDNGINPDGIAGSETLNLLFTDYPDTAGLNIDSPIVANNEVVTENVTASSTGYTTLNINATGSSVSNLQTKLKELEFYNGQITGSLDEDTREAIMSFQQKNFLTVDGIAGPAMQRMLYGITEANQAYSKVDNSSPSADILNLQYTLYELGYYQAAVDGKFNESLENAVKEFQSNNALIVDGVAGSDTLTILYSSFAKPALATSSEYIALSIGSDGDPVAQLQNSLIELGYLQKFTNVFDEDTKRAIISFQTYNGLQVTGIADVETQVKLYSESAVKAP